jgi:myo-inositol-1(or 4)-monophosphatase
MVKEAGGIVVDFEGNEFKQTDSSKAPYFIACHPEHKEYFLNLVKDGLELSNVSSLAK